MHHTHTYIEEDQDGIRRQSMQICGRGIDLIMRRALTVRRQPLFSSKISRYAQSVRGKVICFASSFEGSFSSCYVDFIFFFTYFS